NQGSRAGSRPQQREWQFPAARLISQHARDGTGGNKARRYSCDRFAGGRPAKRARSGSCCRREPSGFREMHALDISRRSRCRTHARGARRDERTRRARIRLQSGDAGFEQTVLLITGTAPWRGLFERAARANGMHADLFISINHDSVPDTLKQIWKYAGQKNESNDNYPAYAIFISNDNADRPGSLLFGSMLGHELERRTLHYTPHYTLALMGHRRRIL